MGVRGRAGAITFMGIVRRPQGLGMIAINLRCAGGQLGARALTLRLIWVGRNR